MRGSVRVMASKRASNKKKIAPKPEKAAAKPKRRAVKPDKKTAAAQTKRRAAKKTPAKKTPSRVAAGVPSSLEQMLAPTIRAYAEEEARILGLASRHPGLGAAFVHAMSKSDDAIPRKYQAAFREALARVDVEARVKAVIAKMERYWGGALDVETRRDVGEDVRAMYRGEGTKE
jgi:hypothetical protein